jgi:hypothetical protein
MERREFYEPKLDPKADPYLVADRAAYNASVPLETVADEANLIGSIVEGDLGEYGGLHMPVFDVDGISVRVVPSATPGNCHVYIDKAVEWSWYKRLLFAFADAGIVERGYVEASIRQGATFVRKPGVAK